MFNTDEVLALVLGVFIGIVVCVKVVSWVAVKAFEIIMRWIMDHM
jgi:hypothetical protein